MGSRLIRMAPVACLVVVLLAAGTTRVGAGQGPPEGARRMPPGEGFVHPGGGLPPFFMRLDLTDDQRTQIRSLMEEQLQGSSSVRDELRSLRRQLAAAIYVATPDTATISALTAQLAERQQQALEADIAMQVKIAALLTESQRQQIVKWETSGRDDARGPRF